MNAHAMYAFCAVNRYGAVFAAHRRASVLDWIKYQLPLLNSGEQTCKDTAIIPDRRERRFEISSESVGRRKRPQLFPQPPQATQR